MNLYIHVQTGLKWVSKRCKHGFEPEISCILSADITTALKMCRLQHRDIYQQFSNELEYISCYCPRLYVPGGWCRIDGAGPAEPQPPAITSPARAWIWISRKPSFAVKQLEDFDITCWQQLVSNVLSKSRRACPASHYVASPCQVACHCSASAPLGHCPRSLRL